MEERKWMYDIPSLFQGETFALFHGGSNTQEEGGVQWLEEKSMSVRSAKQTRGMNDSDS